MRSRWFLLLIMLALALVVQSPVFGQSGAAGTIVGTVTDQSGNPLRGVKVTAESEVQMGVKEATTNEEGYFTILALSPGKYTVKALLEGMAPAAQEVPVGITSATEVNLLLEAEGQEETLTIIDRPSVVSTSKAAVKETYDLKLMENVPFARPINQFRDIINMTPGTLNLRVRGGGTRQTLFLQDGFEIKEQFPSTRSSAALETQTAAYGADAPTAMGGVQNLVTRSGSNQFRFEFTSTYETGDMQLFKEPGDASTGEKYLVINPTFSGPIIKDKLWYHVNLEEHLVTQPQARDPLLILPEPAQFFNSIFKVTAKTRWQINSRNKIEVLFNGDWPYQRNAIRTAGTSDEAQRDRLAERYFGGLTWETLLTDSLLFRSQVGYILVRNNIYPVSCRNQPYEVCDSVPNVTQTIPTTLSFQNAAIHNRTKLDSLQFINTLEWFVSTKNVGNHNLRLRDTVYTERDMQQDFRTGGEMTELVGTVPLRRTQYFSNDPRQEAPEVGWFTGTSRSFKHVLTASDTWAVTPFLTAVPALSYVHGSASNDAGTFPYSANALAPSVSLVWDVTRDGRTVLRTSGSIYTDVDLSQVSRHTLGAQVSQRCNWNPATEAFDQNCIWQGGASRNTVGGDGKELVVPRTYEVTLGGQREVTPGTAVSLDFIYRRFTNLFEDVETNRIWNDAGTQVLGFRNGRNETVLDLRTPDGAYREYTGVTLAVTKTEGNLLLNGSYTLGWLNGTVLDGFQNFWGTIPAMDKFLDGPLADDHRHEIKVTTVYDWTPWLSTGAVYTYISSTPTNRLFFNEGTGAYQTYHAQTGMNPGNNINDPADDTSLRLPDRQLLSIQARAKLEPFLGQDVSLSADVNNVLGLRTVLTQGTRDGVDFGLPLTRQNPFSVRIGLDFRWPSQAKAPDAPPPEEKPSAAPTLKREEPAPEPAPAEPPAEAPPAPEGEQPPDPGAAEAPRPAAP